MHNYPLRREYQVWWTGYAKTDAEWIPKADLNCPLKIRNYEAKKRREQALRQINSIRVGTMKVSDVFDLTLYNQNVVYSPHANVFYPQSRYQPRHMHVSSLREADISHSVIVESSSQDYGL